MTHQVKNKFEETKLVVIVRADFKHAGYALPQSLHALADFAYEYPDVFKQWKTESNSVVCLAAKSEEHLLKLYDKYSQLTPTVKFFEPDVNEWTSICLYGTPEIRKTLSSLPLALKNLNKDYEKAI